MYLAPLIGGTLQKPSSPSFTNVNNVLGGAAHVPGGAVERDRVGELHGPRSPPVLQGQEVEDELLYHAFSRSR